MTLELEIPEEERELKPRITVFGVGGAGGNAVNNMIRKGLEGVEFIVTNTDAQALGQSEARCIIQLGTTVTQGLGAGADPSVGADAARESLDEIIERISGVNMCFITAGMGGGTGTGAAPIIAQAAKDLGILTVGVVTKPFQFEGSHRMRLAESGVADLQECVDTLIIIPNQNLFRIATERTSLVDAFLLADDVLFQGVKGVTDLMVKPGLVNLDFADVRAVMRDMGKAMMGTGEESGEGRSVEAAKRAIANPLLDEISLKGARGVIVNITGGADLTLFEVDEAADYIRKQVDPEANIIVGSTFDTSMEGVMRVSVVATGIEMCLPSNAPMTRSSPMQGGGDSERYTGSGASGSYRGSNFDGLASERNFGGVTGVRQGSGGGAAFGMKEPALRNEASLRENRGGAKSAAAAGSGLPLSDGRASGGFPRRSSERYRNDLFPRRAESEFEAGAAENSEISHGEDGAAASGYEEERGDYIVDNSSASAGGRYRATAFGSQVGRQVLDTVSDEENSCQPVTSGVGRFTGGFNSLVKKISRNTIRKKEEDDIESRAALQSYDGASGASGAYDAYNDGEYASGGDAPRGFCDQSSDGCEGEISSDSDGGDDDYRVEIPSFLRRQAN